MNQKLKNKLECCEIAWRNLTAAATKLLLELLYATRGVHETFFTSEDRVGVGRNIDNKYLVFYTVDSFLLLRALSRGSQKLTSCRYIYVSCWKGLGMDICFHGIRLSRLRLTLARFEAWVGFVDDIYASLTTYHLAVRMTVFQCFNGAGDFHRSSIIKKLLGYRAALRFVYAAFLYLVGCLTYTLTQVIHTSTHGDGFTIDFDFIDVWAVYWEYTLNTHT